MKNILKNYVFKNELAEFYLDFFDEEPSITGKITVTKNGEINGELPYLSFPFQKALLENNPEVGSYRTLPKLFVKICRTNQYFYLNLPSVSWTKKSLGLSEKKSPFSRKLDEYGKWEEDNTLGNPKDIWRISGIRAALFFSVEQDFPKILSVESLSWNLKNFRKWAGAYIHNSDVFMKAEKTKKLRKVAGYDENSDYVFTEYKPSLLEKNYNTDLGVIKFRRSYIRNGWNIEQLEGKIESSSFLRIVLKRYYDLNQSAELYSGVEAFFRTFVSRDKDHQIVYPEVILRGGCSAKLIIPRVGMEASISYSSHPTIGSYLLPFNRIKEHFGRYLVTYLENSKKFQSGYSIYAKDVCKLENNEGAFFSLIASLEYLLKKAFPDTGKNLDQIERCPKIKEIVVNAFKDLKELTDEEKEPFIQKASAWGSNPSVKNRLKSALNELECGLEEEDIKKYLKELYDKGGIRHKLAHQATIFTSGNKDNSSSEFVRLAQVLFTTRMIVCALIMKSVGFNRKEILLALARSSEFSFERENSLSKMSSFSGLFENLFSKTAEYELSRLDNGFYSALNREQRANYKESLISIKEQGDQLWGIPELSPPKTKE